MVPQRRTYERACYGRAGHFTDDAMVRAPSTYRRRSLEHRQDKREGVELPSGRVSPHLRRRADVLMDLDDDGALSRNTVTRRIDDKDRRPVFATPGKMISIRAK